MPLADLFARICRELERPIFQPPEVLQSSHWEELRQRGQQQLEDARNALRSHSRDDITIGLYDVCSEDEEPLRTFGCYRDLPEIREMLDRFCREQNKHLSRPGSEYDSLRLGIFRMWD